MILARRLIIAVTVAAILVLPGGARAEEKRGEAKREAPHYESPVLSLLFLPFNLLIRMASTLEPEKRRGEETKSEED